MLPREMRARMHIKKGAMFALQAQRNVILLKEIGNPILKEDLSLLKSVEKAWKEIDGGKYRRTSKADFLKELATW